MLIIILLCIEYFNIFIHVFLNICAGFLKALETFKNIELFSDNCRFFLLFYYFEDIFLILLINYSPLL